MILRKPTGPQCVHLPYDADGKGATPAPTGDATSAAYLPTSFFITTLTADEFETLNALLEDVNREYGQAPAQVVAEMRSTVALKILVEHTPRITNAFAPGDCFEGPDAVRTVYDEMDGIERLMLLNMMKSKSAAKAHLGKASSAS